jgi:S-adenosyl methyltransferase
MMLGILGNVADYDQARSIVKRLLDSVPSGSYLVVNDGTNTSEEIVEGARVSGEGGHRYIPRCPERIAGFFDGLDLQEPGVVSPHGGGPSSARPASPPRSTPAAASPASRRAGLGAVRGCHRNERASVEHVVASGPHRGLGGGDAASWAAQR